MPEVMQPLSTQDIESELSYAYIHAVAAFAAMTCVGANRVEDGMGSMRGSTAWNEPRARIPVI